MSRLILPTRRKVLLGLSALAAPAIIRPASATLLVDGLTAVDSTCPDPGPGFATLVNADDACLLNADDDNITAKV